MVRIGVAPYLECSSRGFRPFSAFYARIRSRGNRSIEEIYQAAKIFSDGSTELSIKEAKGRQAVNMDQVGLLYGQLWREYIEENPEYKEVLFNATGLSDIFGQPGHMCQAISLWDIKESLLVDPAWL